MDLTMDFHTLHPHCISFLRSYFSLNLPSGNSSSSETSLLNLSNHSSSDCCDTSTSDSSCCDTSTSDTLSSSSSCCDTSTSDTSSSSSSCCDTSTSDTSCCDSSTSDYYYPESLDMEQNFDVCQECIHKVLFHPEFNHRIDPSFEKAIGKVLLMNYYKQNSNRQNSERSGRNQTSSPNALPILKLWQEIVELVGPVVAWTLVRKV